MKTVSFPRFLREVFLEATTSMRRADLDHPWGSSAAATGEEQCMNNTPIHNLTATGVSRLSSRPSIMHHSPCRFGVNLMRCCSEAQQFEIPCILVNCIRFFPLVNASTPRIAYGIFILQLSRNLETRTRGGEAASPRDRLTHT